MAEVLAGGMVEVEIGLLNADSLEVDEEVAVTLTPQTVTVEMPSVTLTRETTRRTVTISADMSAALMSGTVIATGAVEDGSGAVDSTQVEQATLSVDVLAVEPVVREFGLSFVPASASIVAGGTVDVMLELSNAGLLADDGSEEVVVTLTTQTVTVDSSSVTLTRETTRRTVTINAAANAALMSGTVVAMGVVMSGGSLVDDTAVASTTLSVEVVAVPPEPIIRQFVLSFVPPSASVVTGATTEVQLVLSNPDLLADDGSEVVAVTLMATTVTVTAPVGPVTLTRDTSSVTLTIDAALADVGSLPEAVTATGVVMLGGSPVDDTAVASATLTVDVLAVEPVVRVFGLQFEVAGTVATMASVVVGTTTEVEIGLLNADSLELGEVVVVTLTPQTVTVDSSSVTLTRETTRRTVTISAASDVASLLGTVIATGAVEDGSGAVDDTRVESATLTVDVVARRFRLLVESVGEAGVALISERVVAGGTAEVVVRVLDVETSLGTSRLFADETVRVDFVYEGGEGVTLSSVLLGSGNPTPYLGDERQSTATVTASLVATDGALVLAGTGLSNAEIEPVSLAVTILPREFRLVFTPPEIGILTGTTETVTLSLSGASLLLAEEKVVVGLSLLDDSTVSLVPMGPLTFGASTPSYEVVLEALADTSPGATTLLASVESSPTNLGDVAFLDGELRVTVVGERGFTWVFRSAETGDELLEVVAIVGETIRLLVSLEGIAGESLGGGEQVAVDLTVLTGMMVSPPTLMVSAGAMSQEVVLTAAVGALSGMLELRVRQTTPSMLEQAVEPESTLPIRVVREFELRFEVQGAVATIAQVLAGGSTEVVVMLSNAGALLMGEAVQVSLSGNVVTVDRSGLTLTALEPSTTFIIYAAHDAMAGEVGVSGRVLSGGFGVPDAVVIPASLPVTVEPRRFRLSLRLPRFGHEVGSGIAIPGGEETRSTINVVVAENITVGALSVHVSITHSSVRDIAVYLESPGGGNVRLDSLGATGADLRRTYTSEDHAGLASLLETQARGEWGLSVLDLGPDGGRLYMVDLGTDALYRLDPATGMSERVGNADRFGVGSVVPNGLVSHNGRLYMVDINTAVLYRLDPATGGAVRVGNADGFGAGVQNPSGLASHNGTLYMVDVRTDALYRLDATTGTAARVGDADGFGVEAGLPNGLASHNGTLYMVDNATDALYRLDPATGRAARVGTAEGFDVAAFSPSGLASHNGRLYMVDINTAALYRLDPVTGIAARVGDVGVLGPSGLASHNGWLDRWGLEIIPSANDLQVVAGGTAPVLLGVSPVATSLGVPELFAGETLSMNFMYDGGEGVNVPAVTLTVDMLPTVLTVMAEFSATAGTLVATGGGLVKAVVEQATLPVVVVRGRRLALVFATPEGDALDTARVLAGGSTEVVVMLSNARVLLVGESVQVSLSGNVVTVDRSELTLTAASTFGVVTIAAAHDAMAGEVGVSGRVLLGGFGVLDAVVIPASLPVTVESRRFRLSLMLPRFSYEVGSGIAIPGGEETRSTINAVVAEDVMVGALSVHVSITHPFVQDIAVYLDSPGGEHVRLDSLGATGADLRRTYTSEDHAGLASLVETQARGGEWVLSVLDSGPDGGTLYMVDVSTDALYRLDPATGMSERVGNADRFGVGSGVPNGLVSHNGRLYMVDINTAVLYRLDPATGGAVRVGDADEFGVGVQGPSGLASHNGRLYMVDINTAVLYRLDPATGEAVRVGDADRFGVAAFSPSGLASHDGTLYMVDSGTDALYRLDSATGRAARVTAAEGFDVAALSPSGLASHNGTLYMVDNGTDELYRLDPATGTAARVGDVGVLGPSGLASYNGWLDRWGLEIIPSANDFQVVAGGTAPPVLLGVSPVATSLGVPELFAGETLSVNFMYDGGEGVNVPAVTLTADMLPTVLTVMAEFGATAGTLVATGGGLVKAVVEQATLPVDIVPREFTLSFDPPFVSVLAGGSNTVQVRLSGVSSLGEGETLPVDFMYDEVGVSLSPSPLLLTLDSTTEVVVPLNAVFDATSGTLTAMIGGDAVNAVAEPATLAVVIVPREFALSFTTPGGDVLEDARVLAGGSAEVVVRVEGVEPSPGLGVSSLDGTETLTVGLTYTGGTGVGLSVSTVEFRENDVGVGVGMTVTLTATVDATAGTLTAVARNALVNAVDVEQASLPVEIVPREFALSFATPEGDALNTARVLAGGSTEVRLVLNDAGALLEGESVQVSLTTMTVTADLSGLTLTAKRSSATFTIEAAYGVASLSGMVEASGMVRSGGTVATNTQVLPATLAVEVVERQFHLSIESVGEAGVALMSERVVAGGTAEVVVRVLGVETLLGMSQLFAGETLTVDFVYMDGTGVSLSLAAPLLLGAGNPTPYLGDTARSSATVVASLEATNGVLELTGRGLVNARVEPVSLAIEVLPSEFALVFTPPEIGILTGTMETVTLSLTGGSLLLAEEKVVVGLSLLDDSTVSLVSMGSLTFGASTPSYEMVLRAAPDASPGMTQLLASVLYSPPNLADAAFVDGELRVEVIDEREFVWVFRSVETSEAELQEVVVVAGATTRLLVFLEDAQGARLFAGEQVEAALTITPAGMTVSPSTLVVSAGMMSREVTLTAEVGAISGVLALNVTQTTLTTLPRGTTVTVAEQATLPVRVLLREFALSFTTPEGDALEEAQVLAGGSAQVRVVLSNAGALLEGESVRVSMTVTTVTTNQSGLTLTALEPSMILTIDAAYDVTPLLGAVEASGAVVLSSVDDTVVNTQVSSATLAVEVVERQFRLSVERDFAEIDSERVVASGTTEVVVHVAGVDDPLLGMSQLFAGETLTVDFVYMDGTGVSLSLAAPLLLGAGNPTPYLGDTARSSATVVASLEATNGVLELTGRGLVNARVEPVSLAIEVLPSEFALVFTPSEIGILTGREATVGLSLTGASLLLAGESVRVELRLADAGTVSLVTPSLLVFDASTPRQEVVLQAASGALPGTTQLLASVEESPTNLADAAFVGDELRVDVVSLREFVWVFRSVETDEELQEAVVFAGATTRLLVSLEDVQGARPLTGDERVEAVLTAPAGLTVSSSQLTLSAGAMSREVTLTADVGAMSGVLALSVMQTTLTTLPRGTTVTVAEQATLPVRVLPREFALSFATPEGDALNTARVLAGGSTEVRLVLNDAGALLEGESVQVSLTTMTVTADLSGLTLTAKRSSATFTIEAAYGVASLSGMVEASGMVRSGGTVATNTQVLPATLAVEVVERQFRLSVERDFAEIDSERVVASGTTEVVVHVAGVDDPLLGMSQLFAGETLTVDFVYMDGTGVSLSLAAPLLLGAGNPTPYLGDTARSSATVVASLEATNGVLELTGRGLVNARVEPVSLAIEVLPSEFALVFTPSEIGILTGREATVGLSLTGASLLLAGESVRVELRLADAGTVSLVTPSLLVFDASTPRQEVVLQAASGALPGTTQLLASVEESPTNLADAAFVGDELRVDVVSLREFVWVFRSVETDEELQEAVVFAGATTRLLVSLEDVQGARPLTGDERVEAVLTAPAGLTVSSSQLTLSAGAMSREVTLTADVGAMSGVLALSVMQTTLTTLPRGTTVTVAEQATLPVRVLPREFALSFTTPEGEVLDAVRVPAGGSIPLRVRVEDVASLGEDTTLTVALAYTGGTGVGVSSPTVEFSANSTEAAVTLSAAFDAAPGILTATADALMNVMVEPATLDVTIEPRRFVLRMERGDGSGGSILARSFTILANTSTSVTWVLVNADAPLAAGETLELSEFRINSGGITGIPDGFSFDAETTRVTTIVSASADAEGAVVQYFAPSSSLPPNLVFLGNLASEALTFEVAVRQFSLSFIPSTLALVPGISGRVVLRLTGEATPWGISSLARGEQLPRARFTYDGTGISAQLPSRARGRFSLNRDEITVTLNVSLDATDGTLTAMISGTLANAEVAPASLPVEIVPRGFALSFTTLEGTPLETPARVLAGGSTEVRVRLSGVASLLGVPSLGEDETLTVELAYADGTSVVAFPSTVQFSVGNTDADVTLSASLDATSGILTAMAGSTLVNAEVAPTSLPVSIVPREFALSFTTLSGTPLATPARVLAGGLIEVLVRLSGVPSSLGLSSLGEGETLTVELAYADGTSVVAFPSTMQFSAGNTDADVTLSASLDATSGILTAMAGSTLVNAEVAPASLPVEIVPREFALVFTSSMGETLDEARVLAGGSTEVRVVLSNAGALLEGESVRVSLTATTVTTNQSGLTLTALEPSMTLTIDAAYDVTPPLLGAVEASGAVLLGGIMATNTQVLSATLAVDVVERQFRLRILDEAGLPILAARVRAVEGSRASLQVRVEGVRSSLGLPSLGEDETLTVALAYAGGTGVGVSAPTVEFFAHSAEVLVTLTATTSYATSGALTAEVAGEVLNANVEPATLPVEILPREFDLYLLTLPRGGVLAGGSVLLIVRNVDSEQLLDSEEIRVSLTATTVTVGESELILTTMMPATRTIVEAVDVSALSGLIEASVWWCCRAMLRLRTRGCCQPP